MISTAEPARPRGAIPWLRSVLLVTALGLFALQTPPPWGALWLVVPVAVAASLLACWRFGLWGLVAPVAFFGVTMLREGSLGLWAWWIPACALTGAWMGLREEGEGTTGGQRAWMLIPVLVLAAGLPWLLRYPQLVQEVDRELKASDTELVRLLGRVGDQGGRLATLERAVADNAELRTRLLPHVVDPFEYRQDVFTPDSQRLVELSTKLQDIGDLPHHHRLSSSVAEPLEHRQYVLATEAQRLIEVAASLEDVRDLARRHRQLSRVAKMLEDRQLLDATDPQRLVEVTADLKDVGDLSHRHCLRLRVTDSLEHRQFFLVANPQRFVEFATYRENVSDLAQGNRTQPHLAEPLVDR